MQTSSANGEDKHSEIERFSALNHWTITFLLQHHSSSLFSSFKSMPLFSF